MSQSVRTTVSTHSNSRVYAASVIAVALLFSGASLGAQPIPETAPAVVTPTALKDNPTQVLDASLLTDMERLIDTLSDRRVIFVGEHHDRYEDHLNQLAIIQGLHARGKALAIGMEFFQQPFQEFVDAYVEGRIDEAEFLRRTEYFDRWRFDYRLYRPILRFAREQGIPVIALNLESELTRKAGDQGIAGLSEAEQARIPASIDRDDSAYRARLKAVFEQHPPTMRRDFERFLDVQLLWDEGMAERAANYLGEHPERTLVVLSGSGHVEYGQGIPSRLTRRQPVAMAIVLNGRNREPDPAAADFFLYPTRIDLPPAGMLGVSLDTDAKDSGMRIAGFVDGSGAKAAGLEVGDHIVRIGDQQIANYADIRIALLDAEPKHSVAVEVVRPHMLGADESKRFQVKLR